MISMYPIFSETEFSTIMIALYYTGENSKYESTRNACCDLYKRLRFLSNCERFYNNEVKK